MTSLAGAASAEEVKPRFQQGLPISKVRRSRPPKSASRPAPRLILIGMATPFVYAYVLERSVRRQLGVEAARKYHEGQGWSEPPGAVHLLTENLSPSNPARLLVIFVSNTGDPLKAPEPSK